MSRIRGKNTRPELVLRSLLHRAGLRFRLHSKDLPGRPDLIFPRYRTVVFVHGCFWHRHNGCQFAYEPKSNRRFWKTKFRGNVARDVVVQAALKEIGWKTITVWECELKARPIATGSGTAKQILAAKRGRNRT